MLNSIHHLCIRICTGAFRTSPIPSLYAESGEPSLDYRRDLLSLQMYTRILALPASPTCKSVTSSSNDYLFLLTRRLHTTFGYRVRKLLNSLSCDPLSAMPALTYALPPYSLQLEKLCPGPSLTLAADDSLQSGEVSQNPSLTFRLPPEALKRLHLENAQTHISQVPIYTDGSKTTDGTAFAAILPNRTVARRIPSTASIFTAELHAIWSALAGLSRYDANSFVVYSDSRSALQSVCDPFCDHPMVVEIHRYHLLSARGKTISFCWVPSHVEVAGNEEADRAARGAVRGVVHDQVLPHKDFFPHFRRKLFDQWRTSWTSLGNNKLRTIKEDVSVWSTSCRRERLKEVLLARIRIGLTKYTHNYLLNNIPRPFCEDCLVPLSLAHILAEFPEYSVQRRRNFGADGIVQSVDLRHILRDDDLAVTAVFSFLTETHLLHLL